MVRAAYSSGKPAYGVAPERDHGDRRNSQHRDAARMVRMSKTTTMAQDVQRRNLLAETSIYKAFLAQLQKEGGYLVTGEQKKQLQAAYWNASGHGRRKR